MLKAVYLCVNMNWAAMIPFNGHICMKSGQYFYCHCQLISNMMDDESTIENIVALYCTNFCVQSIMSDSSQKCEAESQLDISNTSLSLGLFDRKISSLEQIVDWCQAAN